MTGKTAFFARRELVPIAALMAASALGWAVFSLNAALDADLLLALRSADRADPLGPAWFEASVAEITALGGFGVLTLVVALAAGYLAVRRRYADAALILVAVLSGTALSEGLKLGFARARPDLVAHIVDTTSMSFPSGHAMLSAITYLTIGALLARAAARAADRAYILAAAIALTLLIGVSRLYLGVHWPSDVLAGWCFGAAWALVCWAVAAWLARARAAHSPP